MSRIIDKGFLQPGNYTIRAKGYTRICTAEEGSGFNDDGEVYADYLDADEIFINLQDVSGECDDAEHEECCFSLTDNETKKEITLSVNREGPFFFFMNGEDDGEEDSSTEFDYENDPELIKDFVDDIEADCDEYYFEEYCPNGILEKTFEIDEPVDLTETIFAFYKSKITKTSLLRIRFPGFEKLDKSIAKGNDVKQYHSIENFSVSDVLEIRAYLDGVDIEDIKDDEE